jgi:prepilin-type N-terminal cleavage/methylation domain-containing protein
MTNSGQPTVRRAFTLVEVLLVSAMMTLLAMLLTTTWSGLGRPLVDAAARAHLSQEANLAAAALARDFGGNLPSSDGHLGFPANGKLVGRMQPGDNTLRLCFDSGGFANGLADWAAPDTVITYQVQNGNLVRWDENAGTTFIVSRYVDTMQLTDQGNGVEIKLTFDYRGMTRTYTLVGLGP